MSLHLPGSVAAAGMLIHADSGEHSVLPPAQPCEKEDSSVLSDNTLAFKGPPSHIRATLWEIVPKEKGTSRGTPSVRQFCCVNLIALSETSGRCWTMPEATLLKPLDPEHLRHIYSIFQQMPIARTRDTTLSKIRGGPCSLGT